MICFISHDQGGSEYLYEYSKKNKHKKKIFCLDGPALKFFKNKNKKLKYVKFNQLYRYKIDTIITGTSYLNSFHLKGIKYAKKRKISSLSIIDDWNEYKKRFTDKKKILLPDKIIVYNRAAYRLARSAFPKQKILLLDDLYLKNILRDLKNTKKKIKNKKIFSYKKILYLSDPVEFNVFSKKDRKLYNEKNVINYLCENLHKIVNNYKLTVRMHPSYIKNKFLIKKYFLKNNLKIKFSNEKKLINDILKHDVILGCETHALIPAFYSKRDVFSVIPDYVKKKNKLKHLKIKELRYIK